ncbi:MAG TPA: S8 family serine peptidase [Actinomycetota bacterium]|nr:S8 family serine peptidase [Actinomycetota bacterium]
MRRALACLVLLGALGLPVTSTQARTPVPKPQTAGADATVIAIIDSGIAPYHWDFLASKMPQATDSDTRNDVPAHVPPHKWLAGFPKPSAFDSYKPLELTLEEKDEMALIEGLDGKDAKVWESVKQSTAEEQHMYWMPGTKIVGALDFAGNQIHGNSSTHGMGTSSVSVGNLHGTCPECLLVFISYSGQAAGEAAIGWAMKQPWIDVISNSYGFSITPVSRDRFYSGSDTKLQKKASERGQTIFFSAGNGQENAFLVPNTTLMSSQEGPDWIVTVGAVSPGAHASYTGHGKPADVAGIGSSYPASYGAPNVGGTGSGGFGGTSNATPQVAGTYARALYLVRAAMSGTSRLQAGGVIARGRGVSCASVRRDCELADRELTADELRNRLFKGAIHTEPGMTPGGVGSAPVVADEEFLNEGHGSYFGRETGKVADWLKEFERIIGPLFGRAKELKRPDGERDWMTVASYCRQHLWGSWSGGYYRDGRSELPGSDPAYPIRSLIETACPTLQPLP